MAVSIGTIKGRHELPVTDYILKEDVTPGPEAYDKAYFAAVAWSKAFDDDKEYIINVYYTGLTEVTLGVIDGLTNMDWTAVPMVYDRESNTYRELHRISVARI